MFAWMDMLLHQIGSLIENLFTATLVFFVNLAGLNPAFTQDPHYISATEFFFYDTTKIFFMLSVIIFIVSVIRSFFPPEKTKRLLGNEKGHQYWGSVFAALLGIVTPFCSCSAVPVFIGFLEAGIPLGVTFSFLISSPMVNEIALVMLWGLFGWKIALIYIATGVVVAIISGIIIGKLKLERYVEDYVWELKSAELELETPTWTQRLKEAYEYVIQILKKIWPYVILGIGLGAIMHGWAPENWLAQYAGKDNPFAVILAVLVGIPLYSNAAGTIPIVKELVRLGMPMGTALAFMMSVTALSLPEMIILRNVLKPQLLAIFVSIMGVTIILIGYLFNIIL